MDRLLFWMNTVGLSLREMSGLFPFGPSFLSRVLHGRRALQNKAFFERINDKLLDPFDYEEALRQLPGYPDPKPEERRERWQIDLLKSEARLRKCRNKKENWTKHYRLYALITWFRLRWDPEQKAREDLIAKWWAFRAAYWAHKAHTINQEAMDELNLEIALLECRIRVVREMLEGKEAGE